MGLYLSEFKTGDFPRDSAYAQAIEAVLSFCTQHSLHCWRSEACDAYPEIEHRIRSSALFVAVIDTYWTSSTWKAHELAYACGGPGMDDAPARTQDLKVVAVLVGDTAYPTWLRSVPHPVTVIDVPCDLAGVLAEIAHVPAPSAGENHRDLLTGLPNRAAFDSSSAASGWLVRVDLDAFVFLNQHGGYQVGDEALVRTAAELQTWAQARKGSAYRVGGDDFLLVLPEMPGALLREGLSALQVQLRLSDYSFGDHPSRPADHLSASFVALELAPGASNSLASLREQADDRLYAERCSTLPPGHRTSAFPSQEKRGFVVLASSLPTPEQKSEGPTEEDLRRDVLANLGLLGAAYASEYPGCESFCKKAIASIFESLCQLNRLARSDPFWTDTNRRPTLHTLDSYCGLMLQANPQDVLALWTMAALDVSRGADGFGYRHWKALYDLGHLDVAWPICAALLQGGPAGISDTALATLLWTIDAVEAARPLLQAHAGSAGPHTSGWVTRVLDLLKEAPTDSLGCSGVLSHVRASHAAGIATIFYAPSSYQIVICNARTGDVIDRFTDYGGVHRDFMVAEDGSRIAYMTNDMNHGRNPSCICIRQFGGAIVDVWTDFYDYAWMACTPDLRRAIVAQSERLAAWDLTADRKLCELPLEGKIDQVAIAGNGRLAVSGSPGGVWLWDLDAGRCLASAGLDAGIRIGSLALDESRVWITDTLGARHVHDFSDALHAQKRGLA